MREFKTYIRWFILVCLFAVPLLVLVTLKWTYFPFIVGKNISFRILTELAFTGWLALIVLGSLPKPKLTLVRVSLLIFLIVIMVADLSGVAPLKSFWSNFERMDGFITLLHVVAYSFVLGSMLNTQKMWAYFWSWSLLVSIIVGLGALPELSGPNATTRIAGTTGNPIYLAIYALFHAFIAVFYAYRSDNTLLKLIYGFVAIFNIAILWFTGTRGALIGLFAGIVTTIITVLFLTRSIKNVNSVRLLRKLSMGTFVGILILVGSFFLMKDSSFVKHNVMLNRLTELTNIGESDRSTSALRLIVWKTALQGVKERPILGWGQENFNYVFNKYYNPQMYWAEQWYDRTHNLFLDWLVAGGILGLLAYIAVYIVLLVEVLRVERFGYVEKSLIIGLLAAYFVHNLTVFDHIISYILFFSLIAWMHALRRGDAEDDVGTGFYPLVTLPIITTLLFIVVYTVNYKPLIQNKTLINALTLSQKPGNIAQAYTLFTDVAKIHPIGQQEGREQFAQAAGRVVQSTSISTTTKNTFAQAAESEIKKQIKQYPHDARFYRFLSNLYFAEREYDKAGNALDNALRESPQKINFLVTLARIELFDGNKVDAQKHIQEVLKIIPDHKLAKEMLTKIQVK